MILRLLQACHGVKMQGLGMAGLGPLLSCVELTAHLCRSASLQHRGMQRQVNLILWRVGKKRPQGVNAAHGSSDSEGRVAKHVYVCRAAPGHAKGFDTLHVVRESRPVVG